MKKNDNAPVYLAWCPTEPGRCSRDAHRLLQRLYEHLTGRPMPPLERTGRGKPHWPEDSLHCSITHSRTLALCAISSQCIGLDAEPLDRKVRPQTWDRVLSAWERQQCRDFGSPQAFWVLKEAYLKYTGQGLVRDLASLEFTLEDSGPRLGDSGLTFRLLELEGHRVALCAPASFQVRFLGTFGNSSKLL